MGSEPEKSRAFNANIVFKTIKKEAMVDYVKGSTEVKQHQQGACIAIHGKKKVVNHSVHSSFSGIDKPKLKGLK